MIKKMSLRRLTADLGSTVAALGGAAVLFTAPPAVAATTPEPATATESTSSTMSGWRTYDFYANVAKCHEVGQSLVSSGRYLYYGCIPIGVGPLTIWELRVLER